MAVEGASINSEGAMGALFLPFKSIPVIDMSSLRSGDSHAYTATADQIAQACCEVGFFYISNHGVPQELIDETYALSRRFHELPLAVKNQIHISKSPGMRGYIPVSAEDDDGDPEVYKLSPEGVFDHNLSIPRLHAAFDCALDVAEDDPDFLAGNIMWVPNQWPDWMPEFRETVIRYYGELVALGDILFRSFAVSLGLPKDFFAVRTRKPVSQLRLLHYPANDLPMDNLHVGISGHTDMECFTILANGGPGLQVMNARDEWVEAPPIPGTFVVNVGDLLQAWTNGRFKSTMHRVVNTGRERFSMPFFFAVDYEVIVEPLPQFVSETYPPRYEPIQAGHHIASFCLNGCKHLRRKVAKGDLKIDFPIYGYNHFNRQAVNEFERDKEHSGFTG